MIVSSNLLWAVLLVMPDGVVMEGADVKATTYDSCQSRAVTTEKQFKTQHPSWEFNLICVPIGRV